MLAVHSGRLTKVWDIQQFLAAPAGVFTLVSVRTGARITYKRWNGDTTARFVSVLTGSDNTEDYTPLGRLWHPPGKLHATRLYPLKTPRIGREAPAWKALQWFLRTLENSKSEEIPASIEFWHSGHCARCGRLLTTPESVSRGLGPVCATK